MKLVDIAAGRDITYYSTLVGVASSEAENAAFAARLSHAVTTIPGSRAVVGLLTLVVVARLPLLRVRWVALGICVPYTFLWAGFLSYDLRNELPMVPLAAYLVAIAGAARLVERRSGDLGLEVREFGPARMRPRAVMAIALACVVVLGGLSAWVSVPDLESRHVELQRTIGSESLNELLYEVESSGRGIAGSVLTDYAYLDQLPGFREDTLRREHNPAIHTTYIWPTK